MLIMRYVKNPGDFGTFLEKKVTFNKSLLDFYTGNPDVGISDRQRHGR